MPNHSIGFFLVEPTKQAWLQTLPEEMFHRQPQIIRALQHHAHILILIRIQEGVVLMIGSDHDIAVTREVLGEKVGLESNAEVAVREGHNRPRTVIPNRWCIAVRGSRQVGGPVLRQDVLVTPYCGVPHIQHQVLPS